MKDESARERTERAVRRTLLKPLGSKLFDRLSVLFQRYRPELHYMRGPRPCQAEAMGKADTRRRS